MQISHSKPTYSPFRSILAGLVIVAGAILWLRHDYHDTLDRMAIQQANVARLLETHTTYVIENVDSILDRVGDEVRDHDVLGKEAEQRWPIFSEMAKRLPVSGRLWLYRADGSAVMASHLRQSTNNATDREYFTAQKAPGTGLFIGETVIGKTTGRKVFNLSRRLETPDGSFAGVAMAAIDIDVFIREVSDLNLGSSASYTLARSDGAIIMRHPDAGATGKRFNLTVLDEATKAATGVITVISKIDQIERQMAFRKHATLPLITVVTVAREEILAPWRQRALLLGVSLIILFSAAAVLIRISNRAAWREQRAIARMQTVLDTVAEGICGLNANGRIVFINPAGAKLLGYSPKELIGKDLHATTHHSLPDGTTCPESACAIHKLLHAGGELHKTDYFWNRNGQGFPTDVAATRVEDLDGGQGVVLAFRDISEVMNVQNALLEQKEFVTSILDSLTEHVAVIDGTGVITAVNAAWREFAVANGATEMAQVSIGANYLDVCDAAKSTANGEDARNVLASIKAVLAGEIKDFTIEYACHSPDRARWFVLHGLQLQGTQRGAVLIHQNVTDRHQAEALLRANEEYFRMLAENMVDVVWKADKDMRFTYVNYADRRLRGFDRDEVIGSTIMDTLTPEGREILSMVSEQRRDLESSGSRGQALRFDIPQRCKDGGEVWMEIVSLPTYDGDGKINGFQGVGRDVSARRREEAQRIEEQRQLEICLEEAATQRGALEELANRDPLTGMNNRRYLSETLPRELSRAQREEEPVAVIMIDLDHFKQINDTHGHAAGDEVLKELASLLKRGTRDSDMICRYGGEEFVVIMPGMTLEHAWQRAESWRTELAAMRIQVGTTDIRVTFSAGLAVFPQHGEDMAALLASADKMLYRAKHDGRNRISVSER